MSFFLVRVACKICLPFLDRRRWLFLGRFPPNSPIFPELTPPQKPPRCTSFVSVLTAWHEIFLPSSLTAIPFPVLSPYFKELGFAAAPNKMIEGFSFFGISSEIPFVYVLSSIQWWSRLCRLSLMIASVQDPLFAFIEPPFVALASSISATTCNGPMESILPLPPPDVSCA